MWQNIVVFVVIALAAGVTAWKFYAKFTGKSSCCGGSGGCSGCQSQGSGGRDLKPLTGCGTGCGCSR